MARALWSSPSWNLAAPDACSPLWNLVALVCNPLCAAFMQHPIMQRMHYGMLHLLAAHRGILLHFFAAHRGILLHLFATHCPVQNQNHAVPDHSMPIHALGLVRVFCFLCTESSHVLAAHRVLLLRNTLSFNACTTVCLPIHALALLRAFCFLYAESKPYLGFALIHLVF